MGMFDWVDYECDCPVCGDKVTGFQTKETECELEIVSPEKAQFFYSKCEKCGAWLQAQYVPPTKASIHVEATQRGGMHIFKKNYPVL